MGSQFQSTVLLWWCTVNDAYRQRLSSDQFPWRRGGSSIGLGVCYILVEMPSSLSDRVPAYEEEEAFSLTRFVNCRRPRLCGSQQRQVISKIEICEIECYALHSAQVIPPFVFCVAFLVTKSVVSRNSIGDSIQPCRTPVSKRKYSDFRVSFVGA